MTTRSLKHRGFSLVELMIAMALGLFLTGAALSVMLSNRQAFRTAENLARMQENARTAFELMARDIRAAGGNPCGANQVDNVLNNANGLWWANWTTGPLRGFENSQAGDLAQAIVPVGNNRVAGSDALLSLSGNLNQAVIAASHNIAAAPPSFVVTTAEHGFTQGSILMACDSRAAAIFEVTNTPAAAVGATIQHAAGGPAPGNLTATFSPPLSPSPYQFENGAVLSRLHAAFWYVGNNGRGGNSLYRASVDGTSVPQVDEVIEGINAAGTLQIEYLERNLNPGGVLSNWITAANVTTWITPANVKNGIGAVPPALPSRVEAVRITLSLQSREAIGTNNQPITTTLTETIQLRNRE